MANCMINPVTGRAIKKDSKTAKAIKADRFGRLARGLTNYGQKPAPKKRGRPKGSKNKPK
jgi:hypothetical protein